MRRLGAYFGMCLLTLIPVTLGVALLLIPGIYLVARWFLAAPTLIAEEIGIVEALTASWEDTARCVSPILRMAMIIYLPAYALAALIEFGFGWDFWFVRITVVNLLINTAQVFGCLVAVALYAERIGATGVAKIFA